MAAVTFRVSGAMPAGGAWACLGAGTAGARTTVLLLSASESGRLGCEHPSRPFLIRQPVNGAH